MSRSRSTGTPVGTFAAIPGGGSSGCGSMKSCSGLSASIAPCSSSVYLFTISSAKPGGIHAARLELAPQVSRIVGWDATLLVHQRLRKRRLVTFVMAMADGSLPVALIGTAGNRAAQLLEASGSMVKIKVHLAGYPVGCHRTTVRRQSIFAGNLVIRLSINTT